MKFLDFFSYVIEVKDATSLENLKKKETIRMTKVFFSHLTKRALRCRIKDPLERICFSPPPPKNHNTSPTQIDKQFVIRSSTSQFREPTQLSATARNTVTPSERIIKNPTHLSGDDGGVSATVLSAAASADDVFSLLAVGGLRICVAFAEFVDAAALACASAPVLAPGLADLLAVFTAAGADAAGCCCCCDWGCSWLPLSLSLTTVLSLAVPLTTSDNRFCDEDSMPTAPALPLLPTSVDVLLWSVSRPGRGGKAAASRSNCTLLLRLPPQLLLLPPLVGKDSLIAGSEWLFPVATFVSWSLVLRWIRWRANEGAEEEDVEEGSTAAVVSWSCAEDNEEEAPFTCSTDDTADDEEWNFVPDW